MARPNLRDAALQLVCEPPSDLLRNVRGRFFSIDLSCAPIRCSRVPEQYRVVRADDFPFRFGNFSARVAHRSLSDAGRHPVRGVVVHGAGADRTEIRYGPREAPRDAPGVCPAAGAWIFSLFHLATLQTHTGKRDSEARKFAGTRPLRRQPEPPSFLERPGQGPSLSVG